MLEKDPSETPLSNENETRIENGGEIAPPAGLVRPEALVVENQWRVLRRFTTARIGLGRAGHSLPTREHLEFQLAHSEARDAVYYPFEGEKVAAELETLGLEVFQLHSAARDRSTFLLQPDEGRRLSPPSRQILLDYIGQQSSSEDYLYDALFVVGEGLSAQAIHRHVKPVLELTLAELRRESWRIGPLVVAHQSRVALGDEIGYLLRAEQVAIMIGERPGLTSPDSLGIYLTYAPQTGVLESQRNCISNIRPEGLQYQAASQTLLHLMHQVQRRKLSGIALKDERDLLNGSAPLDE